MDASELIASLQPFTKLYIITSLITTVIVTLKVIQPASFVAFLVPSEWWQIWKIPGSLTYHGSFDMGYIFHLIFFFMTNNPLEKSFIPALYGDFLTMLGFVLSFCGIFGAALNWGGYLVLSDAFTFALTYIYCKKFPNDSIILFFILKIKTAYYPFAIMAISILMGASWKNYVIGLLVGHLYIYLKEILPVTKGLNLLRTPTFVAEWGHSLIRKFFAAPAAPGNWRAAENAQRDRERQAAEDAIFRPFGGRGQRIG